MVKISVNKASRIIGATRSQIQMDIQSGILDSHEGMISVDSLNRAYPGVSIDLDCESLIAKANRIKENAFYNKNKKTLIDKVNEDKLRDAIVELQEENLDLRKQILFLKSKNNPNH